MRLEGMLGVGRLLVVGLGVGLVVGGVGLVVVGVGIAVVVVVVAAVREEGGRERVGGEA